MNKLELRRLVSMIAVIGNVVFIAWVTFNGFDSGWKGTPIEIASFISLVLLLTLNSYLLAIVHRQ